MARSAVLSALVLGLSLVAACAKNTAATSTISTGGGDTGGLGGLGGGEGGADPCECVPGHHSEVIYVLSSEGEIWSYDPVANTFEYSTTLLCAGITPPYSMAVDHRGQAWVLSAGTNLIFNVDLQSAPDTCTKSVYTPYQADFDLFGMAFAAEDTPAACPRLYVMSYSGDGEFSEGPGIGSLGVIEPATGDLTVLGPTSYDGGELTGTGNGRLFALAGVNPAKLVEYDKKTAEPLSTTPLTGLNKTNASALAFFGGAIYFFTEAEGQNCDECLAAHCGSALDACLSDPVCAEALACAKSAGDISDECGGLMPVELQSCMAGPCVDDCFIPPSLKVSQVSKLVLGQSGPPEVAHPQAPIRIVGAGTSPCVPTVAK